MSFYKKINLLRKLLSNKPNEKIVEQIIDIIENDKDCENYFFKIISDINWFFPLKEKGYFSPDKAPKPIPSEKEGYFIIPEWNVLQYLEKVSQQVKKSRDEKIIIELLEVIKNVTYYHVENNKALDNYRTWYYFTKILINIPNEMIPIEIIEFVSIWLDSQFDSSLLASEIATKLLPKFLTDDVKDIEKAEKILSSISDVQIVQSQKEDEEYLFNRETIKLGINPYWLREVYENYSDIIGAKCSENVIYDLAKKIKKLLKDKVFGTYRSFYDEPEYLRTDPFYVLTYGLKRILLAKARSDVEATQHVLRDFLKEEYLYFPKMALFIIGKNTNSYENIFWEILDEPVGDLIFEETYRFGDELRHLLKNLKNVDDYKEKLEEKIENIAEKTAPEEEKEKYIAMFKQAFYEALSHHPYFKKLYKEMKKITQRDIKLKPAVEKVEVIVGPGSSPLTIDEILSMSNKDLADFMATFRTVNPIKGPTVEGFAALLQEVAKERPEKFTEDLVAFENSGFIYVYHILRGLKNAWEQKKEIDWKALFSFLKQYLNKEEFWTDRFIVEADNWHTNHEWIIGVVGELIQEGSRNDEWAFPEELITEAEEILFLVFEKIQEPQKEEIADYISHALNSPIGKTLEAFIILALRIARIQDRKSVKNEIKWSEHYRLKYEHFLEKRYVDAFTLLGRYLPNFYFLDRIWVESRIRMLEEEKGSECWEAWISGYLSIGNFYKDLFLFIKPHLRYGLTFKFKDERISELLIHHIAFSYLWGIDTELFQEVLERFDHKQINEIIGFFWEQREYLKNLKKEQIEKILDFWKYVFEKYDRVDELSADDKKVLSNILKLTIFVPEINETTCSWLKQAAPFVHEEYNSPFFIEYLDFLKEKGDAEYVARCIGNVFQIMVQHSKYRLPDYDKKHIRSIIEFLFNNGARDLAFEICDEYLRNGYEFLRDLQEKYSDIS